MLRTAPFLLIRLTLLSVAAAAGLVWWGLGVGGGLWAIQAVHPGAGAGIIVACVLVYAIVWWLLLRPMLYFLKCGHVAVLTRKIEGQAVGLGGLNMLHYGYRAVRERFGTVAASLTLDEHVRDVVYNVTSTAQWLAAAVPLPGVESAVSFLGLLIKTATEYLDETILSYILSRGDGNPYQRTREGLLYFCQNHQTMLRTSIGVVVLDRALTALFWLSATALCGWLAYTALPMEPAWGLLADALAAIGASVGSVRHTDLAAQIFVSALIAFPLGWVMTRVFHRGLLHPLFLTMIVTRFHATIHGQPLDPSWEERLREVASDYDAISDLESAWVHVTQPF